MTARLSFHFTSLTALCARTCAKDLTISFNPTFSFLRNVLSHPFYDKVINSD